MNIFEWFKEKFMTDITASDAGSSTPLPTTVALAEAYTPAITPAPAVAPVVAVADRTPTSFITDDLDPVLVKLKALLIAAGHDLGDEFEKLAVVAKDLVKKV